MILLITYMCNLKYDTNQHTCETKTDSHTQQTDVWLPTGRSMGEGQIGRLGLCIQACALYHVRLFTTPWTITHQAPLSMGFPRQEYYSGLPFPIPGDLPDRILCLLQSASGFLFTEPSRSLRLGLADADYYIWNGISNNVPL